eukprot:TRINITY_DN2763_c0_g2_i1.p1 TRINITY_DN2763_c0_g2~~TRINITY_DN2763_c0_g2_i1.p1  ORF type:complete len:392 (-),score=79.55 TRINITY_DN2763_c0_g2_i1:292-1401(-)
MPGDRHRSPGERDGGSSSSGKKKDLHGMKVAGGKFELKKKLGAGCFGEVWKAVNTVTGLDVAVKVEDHQSSPSQLEMEATTLNILRQPVQPQGFAEYYFFGREETHFAMVMELLGKSLEDMLQTCPPQKLQVKTAVLVARQVLHRIEYLHSKGIVHRDIKPENFTLGIGPKMHHVYLIDFGLSKRYWDKVHVAWQKKSSLTGTARYASINAHKGVEQSRRDDLEAIGHMLLYFVRGSLPWSGLDAKTKQEKYRKIMEKKESTALAELCQGFPKAFETYLAYTRELVFHARPDYDKCQNAFNGVLTEIGEASNSIVQDWEFEWFDGSPETLAPVHPRTRLMQPDDPEERKGAAPRKRWYHCCGSATNVRD